MESRHPVEAPVEDERSGGGQADGRQAPGAGGQHPGGEATEVHADHDRRGEGLNEAQRDVIERLGRPRSERPEFSAGLGKQLREELNHALSDVAEQIDPAEPMFVNKHKLAGVLGCETRFMHEDQKDFEWSAPTARGSVAHKAIELGINRTPAPPPPVLVDGAIERLGEEDYGLATWLETCSAVDLADLRSKAISSVAAFAECWPPLQPAWRPVTESRSRVELCDSRIVLGGKCDLTLGQSAGRRAGKVIIDLKTGSHRAEHAEDLYFYALLETVRLGTPPRMLATYYLDTAEMDCEEVTEAGLGRACDRTIEGIRRYAELKGLLGPPPEPTEKPGPPCRWCDLLSGCAPGQDYEDRKSAYW